MTAVTVEQIQEALSGVMDPELKRNLVELGMVRGMHIEGEQVKITLALTTLECPFNDQIDRPCPALAGRRPERPRRWRRAVRPAGARFHRRKRQPPSERHFAASPGG